MGLSRNELLQTKKSFSIQLAFAKERIGLSRNEILRKKN
jgi:hypothetical protein